MIASKSMLVNLHVTALLGVDAKMDIVIKALKTMLAS